MSSRSYVVGILKALKATQGRPVTPSDLYAKIAVRSGHWLLGHLSRQRAVASILRTLEELRALGIVANSGDGWSLPLHSRDGELRVVLPVHEPGQVSAAPSSQRPTRADGGGPSVPTGGQGGRGGPPDPPAQAGGDGQDGGGGVGEILRHPILFSIDEEAFDASLDRALAQY